MTTRSAATTEYTVVLRTRSAARFVPEEGWELTLNAPNVLPNAVRLRTYTRWITEGGQDLPRELIVEVKGEAGSLDEAVSKFAVLAQPIATVAGFVANVRVGSLEVHLAYDSTPSHQSEPSSRPSCLTNGGWSPKVGPSVVTSWRPRPWHS